MKTLNESELHEISGGFAALSGPLPTYQPATPMVVIGGGDGTLRHVDN